jgi:hypothetical protein
MVACYKEIRKLGVFIRKFGVNYVYLHEVGVDVVPGALDVVVIILFFHEHL